MTAPAPRPANPMQTKPAVLRTPPASRPGADFDTAPAPAPRQVNRPVARPVTRPAQAAMPRPQGGDRFIIEDGSGQTVVTVQTGDNEPTASARGLSGSPYVQIASFGVEARAIALARKVGGSMQRAGSVWRVRMGPYRDEASARAALSDIVSKGYQDARISR